MVPYLHTPIAELSLTDLYLAFNHADLMAGSASSWRTRRMWRKRRDALGVEYRSRPLVPGC